MNILAEAADIDFSFNWPGTASGWLILLLVISLVVAGFFSAMAGWVKFVGSEPKKTALFFLFLLVACFVAVAQGRV